MSSQSTDYLSAIKNMDEDFQSYMIIGFILIILIIFIGYMIYLSKLENSECDYMNTLYPSVDGNIIPITTPLNRKRGTKPISYYKEEEPYKYIQYIEEMIPSVEMYDETVSHAKHQQSIISNELYDKFCEENEKRYIDNFMICMFGKNL